MTKSIRIILLLGWALLTLLLLLIGIPQTRFSANVTDLLPSDTTEIRVLKELAETDQGRLLTVHLSVADNADPAAVAAAKTAVDPVALRAFRQSLAQAPAIASIWEVGPDAFRETATVLFEERYFLLLPAWLQARSASISDAADGNAARQLARAVVDEIDAFLDSPDSFALSESIPSDPFLLLPRLLEGSSRFLPAAADKRLEGVTLWVKQAQSPFSELGQQPVFDALDAALHSARQAQPQIQMLYTGVAPFAHASKAAIKREIQWLNLLCLGFVLLVCLFAVRSLRRTLSISLTVLFALLSAAASVIWLFPQVHILALVVGSILAGIAVDYAFHLLLEDQRSLHRKAVTRAVLAGSLSSAAGFVTLLWAPLPFLQQVGAFVGSGLLAALLAALLLRPPPGNVSPVRAICLLPFVMPRWTGPALAIILLPGVLLLHWGDRISALEYPLPELQAIDQQVRDASGDPTHWQPWVVHAEDWQIARERLAQLHAHGLDENAVHAGNWLPCVDAIRATHQYFAELHGFAEELRAELDQRGYLAEAFEPFFSAWRHYQATPVHTALYGNLLDRIQLSLPGPMANLLHRRNGLAWFMILLPPDAAPLDAADSTALFELQPTRLLNDAFRSYRLTVLRLVLVSILALATVILFAFGVSRGMAALALPACAVLSAAGIAGFCAIEPGLFHLIGAFLAFCIGLDYAIFAVESRRQRSRMPASITISAISTMGVFGILATSKIPGVEALGLTVLVTVFATFSLLLCGWPGMGSRPVLRPLNFDRLPHGESARMIEELIHLDDLEVAVSLSPVQQPGFAAESLIEAMAQAAALWLAHVTGESSRKRIGMLVVVQQLSLPAANLSAQQFLVARVNARNKPINDAGLLNFSGSITTEDGSSIATADFSIFIP